MTEDDLQVTLLATILTGIAHRRRPLTELAELTGLPDIILGELAAGQHGGIVDRVALWPLLRAVAALGQDVTIGVRRAREGEGAITVTRLAE